MDCGANFRNAVINEPRVFAPQQSIQTPVGRVAIPSDNNGIQRLPPIPPKPYATDNQMNMAALGSSMGMYPSSMGMYGNGPPYSNSMYPNSYNRYGGMMSPYYRYGNYPSMYTNGFNNGMRDPMDPESRFIQIAEESSRPAFQSIESLVMAIGNIASMLDSTFFALTSSFRAILGVAANFGQLRGVFAQFWSTFALIRGISWLYKKLLFMLGLSKVDPTTQRFSEIFSSAASSSQMPNGVNNNPEKKVSAWPILTFLGLIFATPYLIMKLIGQVSTTALEESRNPQTWVRPYVTESIYPFKATSPSEITLFAGQIIKLAPREVQQTHKLLNTGWALATIDDKTSGLVPINYLRRVEVNNTNQTTTPPNDADQHNLLNSDCATTDKAWDAQLQSDASVLNADDLERLRDV